MISANLLADLVKKNPDLFRQVGVEPVQGPQTIEVTSLGPGQAMAVAYPQTPAAAPAAKPAPVTVVPAPQPVQAQPTPAPQPAQTQPTSQFIYNQYRRPEPPRLMFEGLPSLLERFRMQPSAQQQQNPMPPQSGLAQNDPAVADFFRFLNSRRML